MLMSSSVSCTIMFLANEVIAKCEMFCRVYLAVLNGEIEAILDQKDVYDGEINKPILEQLKEQVMMAQITSGNKESLQAIYSIGGAEEAAP